MKSICFGLICLLPFVPAAHSQDKASAPAAAVSLPKPATDLAPATYQYQVTLELNGQKMNMKVTTAITDSGSSWTAVNTMDTPQGAASDTATIAKSSLAL